jgi:hypothetical protein
MYHTFGFQLVTIWGYLCKLHYVYILTYSSKQTNSITFLQSNHFPEHFIINFCNLPISQVYKEKTVVLYNFWPSGSTSLLFDVTAGFFFAVQQPRHPAGYSPPSSAHVILYSSTSSPQYAFTPYRGKALTLPLLTYSVLNSKQQNL